jgi:hypothetical protein
MAILAMLEHGQDARGTSSKFWVEVAIAHEGRMAQNAPSSAIHASPHVRRYPTHADQKTRFESGGLQFITASSYRRAALALRQMARAKEWIPWALREECKIAFLTEDADEQNPKGYTARTYHGSNKENGRNF